MCEGGVSMAIKYFKLLDMLNKKSVSKGELQKMACFSSATMAKISAHKPVNLSVIDSICEALNCQPGDIMEYVTEPKNETGAAL
jgi:DNA-binding Xre family transcriptional regulator